jgi:hypothetical protein
MENRWMDASLPEEEAGLVRAEIRDDDGAAVVQKPRGFAEHRPLRQRMLVRS